MAMLINVHLNRLSIDYSLFDIIFVSYYVKLMQYSYQLNILHKFKDLLFAGIGGRKKDRRLFSFTPITSNSCHTKSPPK